MGDLVAKFKANQSSIFGGLIAIILLALANWWIPSALHAIIWLFVVAGGYLLGSRIIGPLIPPLFK